VNGEAPCGGVVEKIKKLRLAVNFRSIFAKKTNRKVTRRRIPGNSLKCAVSSAKRLVTKLTIVTKTQT